MQLPHVLHAPVQHSLYALRGYFRDHAPPDPDPYHPKPEGIYQHCSDSRVRPSRLLNLSEGEYVFPAAPGAFIPPWEGGKGLDRDTARTLNLHLQLSPSIRTIVIEGHTDCAAIREIYYALIDGSLQDHAEAEWLAPWAPEDMHIAFQALRQQASADEMKQNRTLQREFERIVIIQSLQHPQDYVFHRNEQKFCVSELVHSGELQLVACIKDVLTKLDNGKHPLEIYDPSQGTFRDILDVYCETHAINRTDFANCAALFAHAHQQLEAHG